ncbi:hypothetical protein B0J14DRAFT_679749 [Halenospora varia]|nr:hypothetical protein B0J14DRAFT_679749 [Halenospora varia]
MAAPAEEQLVALPNIMADLDFRAIEECTISGGEGRGLNYQACELSNLNLYNCSIKDSKLENCKLFECAVGTPQVYEAHNTDTYNTWARDCQFVDCLLENVKILRSSVVFSGLGLRPFQQCHIQTSTIAGVIPQDCHFLNCTIDNAKLYESTLHQCELAANIPMRKCTVSKASLIDLHKFAPQIRAMIFSYCLDWTYKDPTNKHNVITSMDKTPSLIIALREDEKLYQEALHIFYEKNFFRISKDNEESRQAMPLSVWRTMKKCCYRGLGI